MPALAPNQTNDPSTADSTDRLVSCSSRKAEEQRRHGESRPQGSGDASPKKRDTSLCLEPEHEDAKLHSVSGHSSTNQPPNNTAISVDSANCTVPPSPFQNVGILTSCKPQEDGVPGVKFRVSQRECCAEILKCYANLDCLENKILIMYLFQKLGSRQLVAKVELSGLSDILHDARIERKANSLPLDTVTTNEKLFIHNTSWSIYDKDFSHLQPCEDPFSQATFVARRVAEDEEHGRNHNEDVTNSDGEADAHINTKLTSSFHGPGSRSDMIQENTKSCPQREMQSQSHRPPESLLKRRVTGTKSKYFSTPTSSPNKKRRRSGNPESCLPFPKLSEEKFGLLQEHLWNNPFHLLVMVILLNQTSNKAAYPCYLRLTEKYFDAESLAQAELSQVAKILEKIGLQNNRAKTLIRLAQTWVDSPPTKGKRHRNLHYPNKHNGADISPKGIIDDEANDPRTGAWEAAHLPGVGHYALDSWRIFCRDVCRGVAQDYKGKGVRQLDFEPEWKRVVPSDKELKAYLRWMWLKEGWEWDPNTGKRKRRASQEALNEVENGEVIWDEDASAGEDVLIRKHGDSPQKKRRGTTPRTESRQPAAQPTEHQASSQHMAAESPV